MSLSNILKSDKLLLVTYVILMSVLLFARDVLSVSIGKNVFIVLVIVFSFMMKYENLLSLILFTLPLMWGLPGNFFLPIWCLLVSYHQIQHKSFRVFTLIFWLLIVVWEITISSFYPFTLPIISYLGYFSALFLTFFLIAEDGNIDYKTPVLCFCIGCCVLLGVILIMYLNNPVTMYTDGDVRMGGDMYIEQLGLTLKTNANNIGYISAASLACTFAMFYYRKIKLFGFCALAGVSFVCGIFSVSRTWALSLVLLLLIYFIFQKENKKSGYIMLCVVVLLGVYYVSKNPVMLDAFISRFTGDNIETGGERTVLFSLYNQFLSDHPINLVFGTSAQLYKEVTGIYHSTHNSLQQIWMSYGILGFILILTCYLIAFKKNWTKNEYMACMPMLIIVFFLQTIQILNPYNGLYPVITAFFIMKMVKQDRVLVGAR